MSQDPNAQSSQSAVQSDGGANPDLEITRSAEELTKRLRETSEEAKKYRQKNAEFQAKFDAIESERLAEQGQFKEMAAKEKARADKAENESKARHANFALRTVENQVKVELAKRGCVDLDTFVRTVDLTELEPDDDYVVDPKLMREVLDKAEKERSYFFSKTVATHKDMPIGKSNGQAKEKSLSEMTIAEKQAFLISKMK